MGRNPSFRDSSGPWRQRGAVDALDVGLSIALVIAIPAITYFVHRALSGGKTTSTIGQFGEKIEAPAELDPELARLKLDYYRKRFDQTIRAGYREQLANAPIGTLRLEIRDWTQRAVENLWNSVKSLQGQMEELNQDGEYNASIERASLLAQECDRDLEELKGLE